MTRDELIENEAEKLFPDIENNSAKQFLLREAYKNCINSDLNKDLQEFAVIEGKIEVFKAMIDNNFFANSLTEKVAKIHLKQLETQRQTLLTKLNLEG